MALMTRCTPLGPECGLPSFTFAGFTFPRYLATLPRGSLRDRLESRRPGRAMCSDYYHAPRPNNRDGWGFYLDSDGPVTGLRYELVGPEFYADDDGSTTMQGIVLRLPRGRGFLAGWTMGRHMASSCEAQIFSDPDDAAACAKSWARDAEEREREYQAAESARMLAEEMGEE